MRPTLTDVAGSTENEDAPYAGATDGDNDLLSSVRAVKWKFAKGKRGILLDGNKRAIGQIAWASTVRAEANGLAWNAPRFGLLSRMAGATYEIRDANGELAGSLVGRAFREDCAVQALDVGGHTVVSFEARPQRSTFRWSPHPLLVDGARIGEVDGKMLRIRDSDATEAVRIRVRPLAVNRYSVVPRHDLTQAFAAAALVAVVCRQLHSGSWYGP